MIKKQILQHTESRICYYVINKLLDEFSRIVLLTELAIQ